MLQANFIVTPSSGDVLATNFTISNLTSGASVKQFVWDFGKGDLIYNIETPTYVYNYPGVYTISLSATDFDGNLSTFTQNITADLVYRDYIRFTQIPERFADPGKKTAIPFKIEVISANPDKGLIVDLFAANSNSTPYQFVPERWSFLNPVWKFLDVNDNVITHLDITPIPVYKDNIVVAVSGSAEFYFVDSTSKGNPVENCPILITATLQTSGFSYPLDSNIYPYESHANNQTVRAGVIWQVNDLFPNLLKVTGNYIDPINPRQWEGIKIPTLITCHSDRSLILPGSESSISEPIFTYPRNNSIGSQFPVVLTLSGLENDEYSIDEEPLYFQATDGINSRTGGYVFTTITPQTTAVLTSITAQSTATNQEQIPQNTFPYPFGFAPNTSVWVSNPQRNTLNKITLVPDPGNCNTINYFRDNGILVDGIIKEVQVPALTSTSTFNYTMSGFSGIYGIAIDPRNYDVVACDTELDRLYRFSNTGEILKTFELSTLDNFNPHKKMYDFWSWQTPAPEASATRFAFYKPVPLSPNPANYILTLGGTVIPTDFIEIDIYEKTIRVLVPISEFDIFENEDIYPGEDITVNVIQLFHPALPQKYISSLTYWTTATQAPVNTFNLTGNPELSSSSNYFIVSIDGVVQRPETYTIDNTTKSIIFSEDVPAGSKLHALYIPTLTTPANWTYTFNQETNLIPLTGNNLYQNDPNSEFLVNIGGVLQHPENYSFDFDNKRLIFKDLLPSQVPISVIQLSIPDQVDVSIAYTPAYVSLDKDYNIWVTLFNSVSVLKFDSDFNLLFSTVPPNVKWQDRAFVNNPTGIDYQSSRFRQPSRMLEPDYPLTIDPYTDEFFLKPPVAETDREGNCWVTYAHPLCSMLVKYSPQGEQLLQIPTSLYSTPTFIAIDTNNNVWVTNFNGSTYEDTALSGNIQHYNSTTGQLLDTVRGISRPTNISIDRNNNLWFTCGLRDIGYYNTTTSTLCTWTLELTGGFVPTLSLSSFETTNISNFDLYEAQQDNELGGLAVDVFDRVWVLDNLQNYAWVISATPEFTFAPIRSFKIIPDVTLGYYIDLKTGTTYTETDDDYYYRSAQATGDWTGNRWYQKYSTPLILSAVPVSGVSETFTISEFKNNHQIRRVNESFNNAEYFRSLALPENLQNNTVLFDKFFTAAVGTGYLSANEDVGQNIYEKIANFVSNHSDIDTCNIDQLLSLAENTGVAASDYSALYPSDIRKMLDIASIPRSKLWGQKDVTPIIPQCICEQLNTETSLITAGDKMILRSKFDNSLSLVNIPLLNEQTVYPLFQFKGYGLAQPVIDNYLFYKYKPVLKDDYIENIIDWESELTTQTPTASTIEEWYGENGAVETAFRYLLTKNLFPK
jgi:PKD repeat protein